MTSMLQVLVGGANLRFHDVDPLVRVLDERWHSRNFQ